MNGVIIVTVIRNHFWGVEMSEDRVCPTCRKHFIPATKNQVYDTDYCRVKAYRQRHKGEAAPIDSTGMLDEIRKFDVEIAHEIEEVARTAGLAFAERILWICYRAINRGVERKMAARLIEAEAPKKRKPRKTT